MARPQAGSAAVRALACFSTGSVLGPEVYILDSDVSTRSSIRAQDFVGWPFPTIGDVAVPVLLLSQRPRYRVSNVSAYREGDIRELYTFTVCLGGLGPVLIDIHCTLFSMCTTSYFIVVDLHPYAVPSPTKLSKITFLT